MVQSIILHIKIIPDDKYSRARAFYESYRQENTEEERQENKMILVALAINFLLYDKFYTGDTCDIGENRFNN